MSLNTVKSKNGSERNYDLNQFLLKHRGKLDPTDYGFSTYHRRVKGLRREEVAQLAAVSVSWYTWLEQGRDISISIEAIKRIGKVLKLSSDEQEYFEATVFGTSYSAHSDIQLQDELKQMIKALDPHPAFVRSENMDILYWNKASKQKIFNWSSVDDLDRNSLKLMFLNPEYKERIPDWSAAAQSTIASFRSYYALSSNKPRFETVINDLLLRSEEFKRMWQEYDVKKTRKGKKSIIDYSGNLRHYSYTALKPESMSDAFLIFYAEIE